jgi:hypothetical protein
MNHNLRRISYQVGLALMVSVATSNLYADEILDQIESSLKAYAEKDYKLALDELKFAEVQLQEKVNQENKVLLPEPLEGWEAEDVKTTSMAMAGGGTMMSRQYKRGKEKLKIEIAANSPLMGMMTMMMKNPMLMSSDPNTKPYRYKRQKGMIEIKRNRMDTRLMLAGQILVSLELSGQNKDELKANGKKTIEQYLDKMDFAKIKEAFLE